MLNNYYTVRNMEKVVNRILIFIFTIGIFNIQAVNANNLNNNIDSVLKFVVIGHTYSTIRNSEERALYIDKINEEKPNYVFILGDSEANNNLIYNEYVSNIKSKLFFSPGNHDINTYTNSLYPKIVGYLDTTIIDDNCNFILFNSLDNIQNINKYLKTSLEKINTNNPTVLLTHHRVWDENLLSNSEYQHDKSYLFSEMLPTIKNKVNYIFAGNSSAQYFGKQYCKEHRVNKNVIFWCDIVENITCYSIGMKYKQHYTIVEVRNNKLAVYPQFVKTEKDTIKKGIANPRNKVEKKNEKIVKYLKKIKILLKSKSIWFAFISGILITLIVTLLFRKNPH